jgi:hypothetical protein
LWQRPTPSLCALLRPTCYVLAQIATGLDDAILAAGSEAYGAARTPPMPYRLLKLAEAHW